MYPPDAPRPANSRHRPDVRTRAVTEYFVPLSPQPTPPSTASQVATPYCATAPITPVVPAKATPRSRSCAGAAGEGGSAGAWLEAARIDPARAVAATDFIGAVRESKRGASARPRRSPRDGRHIGSARERSVTVAASTGGRVESSTRPLAARCRRAGAIAA